jgi:integrase
MADACRSPGLIQRYREELQVRHDVRRTVNTHEPWLRRFLRFHGKRHPREMGSAEVNAFLSHLAVVRSEVGLVVGPLYGSGLRLMEALRLRIKDLDFQRRDSRCAMARVARTG